MSERLSISALAFFIIMALLGAYFAFAAVQGPSGVLRREQLKADTRELTAQRDKLQSEVDRMRNLTKRLSDDFLDIDLLDERARDVLGYLRSDEIIIH
ncbi:FtsB family cell division protein [Paracoccus laeviglucosivorans]|uniref:Cell division protein FtsB n=1 Tax=Paracoccus laeviglucosivorans TaxID=1197861 RepID=A0A521CNC3_9RHOB|nr:septum formation initiator family protein [Paracoccus laeviglucosivorans]SMO60943.1 Cell division protein FtsB [Paracoccus laeviglucosivorans]